MLISKVTGTLVPLLISKFDGDTRVTVGCSVQVYEWQSPGFLSFLLATFYDVRSQRYTETPKLGCHVTKN